MVKHWSNWSADLGNILEENGLEVLMDAGFVMVPQLKALTSFLCEHLGLS